MNDQTGAFIAYDKVVLPPGGVILLRLFVDNDRKQVVASYSVDNGATFKQDFQFAFYARHGTILTATPTAYLFAQGGVHVTPAAGAPALMAVPR